VGLLKKPVGTIWCVEKAWNIFWPVKKLLEKLWVSAKTI
jgi:hypothetical protein